MEFNDDIIKIIKEYSMPKYRKPLHFKALATSNKSFCEQRIELKQTPYSLMYSKLANTDYAFDVIERGELFTIENFNYLDYFQFYMLDNDYYTESDDDGYYDYEYERPFNTIINEDVTLNNVIEIY